MATTTSPSAFRLFIDSLPWRFFRKLAMVQIIVISFVIIITSFWARYLLKSNLTNQAFEQMADSLSIIKESFDTQGVEPLTWCKSLRINWKTRYTLITDEGKVLCDNFNDPTRMDNHSDRPEIIEALNNGTGFSQRYSKTLQKDLLYGAILVTPKNSPEAKYIVRQAIPLEKLQTILNSMDRSLWLFLLPILILTSLISLWGSLQVSFPLRSLLRKVDKMKQLSESDENSYLLDPSDEWDIVEKTLDRAHGNIEKFINELNLENEKISTLLESISDSIIATDKNDHILFINNHFRKNFLDKEIKKQELTHLSLNEIIRHYDVQQLFRQVFIDKVPLKKRNIELPIKGGKRNAFFTLKISPMNDSKGEIFGAVAVFADVTEQKLAEQMREDFVANVSHEVRTPLTAMKGYSQMLKGMIKEKQALEFLNKIEHNSDRLTALFQDILQLSVIESTARAKKEAVQVEDITQTVLSNLKQVYSEKNIEINCHFDIQTIWSNAPMMEQVLTNLVENAIKYTGSGSHITINWRRGKSLVYDILEVIDNGPGIPNDHLPRLFERFYRVDSSRSRDQGGTGLGLAIVKHIIQIHDGKIDVHSVLGTGTTFKIKIPAYNP